MNYKYYFFDEIDSTSSYIKRNFDILNDFTIVETNYQTSGRGRFSRKWISKKGDNLLFSILIKNKDIIKYSSKLSTYSSFILMKFLLDLNPNINISFKRPNDVYVDNKKICGILLETHMNDNKIDGIIIGVGINLNQVIFDDEIKNKATSLKLILNQDINKVEFSEQFYNILVKYFLSIDEKFNDCINFIRKYNFLKNKKVKYSINQNIDNIIIIDINDDCSLKALKNDNEFNIISGELII